jgi:Subtilase family
VIVLALVALAAVVAAPAGAGTARIASDRYIVVFSGTQNAGSFKLAKGTQSAATLVKSAGGVVLRDLSRQIGVAIVRSANPSFAAQLEATGLVKSVGADFSWQDRMPEPPPDPVSDPGEVRQWDMKMIDAYWAHLRQQGRRITDVGILDSGVDGSHPDFVSGHRGPNVNCARSRNFVEFVAEGGPGVGNPDPCVDNQFHGTHVAGTVAAQRNGIGVVGVAPRVELVSVKVCDASGYCYAGGVVDGITYAGRAKLDVINMSFFVDDDEFQESTEFKCTSDPVQRTFRLAVYRAIQYARNRGVTPIAALGNSDQNLNDPEGVDNSDCKVVPAETRGVIGVASLGAESEKAGYSNWGGGPTDVAAPGGNGTTGDCTTTILSTLPGASYGCIQGTSMASPHAAGVAALIISEHGWRAKGGDMKMRLSRVERILEATTIDIGKRGYDKCFGNGRINAHRAVLNRQADVWRQVPPCGEPN